MAKDIALIGNHIISLKTAEKPKNAVIIKGNKINIRNSRTIPKGIVFMVTERMDVPKGFGLLAARFHETTNNLGGK